jgi:hypothetical protein
MVLIMVEAPSRFLIFVTHDLLIIRTYQAKERLHRAARESEMRRRANMLAMQQGQQHPGMKPGMGGVPSMGPGAAGKGPGAASKKRPLEDTKSGEFVASVTPCWFCWF